MNKKIKIFHEVPLCLLKNSKTFTDGEYILPHLLDQNEDYTQYMIQAKKDNRYIIMDNSLHELKDINDGQSYNESRLLYWNNILKPNEFIIPDVWQNHTQSIINAKKWTQIELHKDTTKIAVVQAGNLNHAAVCYQTYKDLGYKKIAFSYGADYYNKISSHPNKSIGKALGRVQIISTLFEMGVIIETDKIHLLGCASPFEFGLYKDLPFIDSIDTSNPIMSTLDGIRYNDSLVLDKPKSNMNDNFLLELDDIDLELMDYNIKKFRDFIEK